jgi:hypothetical protein
MTNEQYLIVSYFLVAGGSVVAGAVTALFLRGPLRKAVAWIATPVGRFLGRSFVAWTLLAAMLGFLSISYFDCNHGTYQSIVQDPRHMVKVTHSQIQAVFQWLLIALMAYSLGLAVMLALPWTRRTDKTQNARQ